MIEHEISVPNEEQIDHAKLIQTGMTALKQLATVPKDLPLMRWIHPIDKEITTENDEVLHRMMNGGIYGAIRELKSEGLEDYARTIVEFNR